VTAVSQTAPTRDPLAEELPTGAAKTQMVRSMFDTIAPRYDLVNRLMTFGLDRWWRRRTVAALRLARSSVVIDVACGTGDLLGVLGRQEYRPIGLDLSAGMLAANRSGCPLVQADALALPLATGSADGAVCGFALRNFSDLEGTLCELGRVVRPGGRISLLEVATPTNPLFRLGHRLWFQRAVPLLGGLLSDRNAYRYLPKSTAYLPSPDALRQLLVRAGFSTVGQRPLSGGVSQLITATRTGLPVVATRTVAPSGRGKER